MTYERRYTDDEVEAILALAASDHTAVTPASTDPHGLTLADLQLVGREVGLEPAAIAAAAASLDARPNPAPRKTLLGSPVSVGTIVDLPREPTDREWQILVAELRETFGAKGIVSSHRQREWSNGNLHAVIEQTEAGHRLRLATYKGNARELNIAGGFGLLTALVIAVAAAMAGKPAGMVMALFFALMGAGTLAWNALHLPRWADQRELQMQHIAERARQLLEAPPKD